jgi:phospholipid/cholesterol/gamma-HCH transport system substrate-binding protein
METNVRYTVAGIFILVMLSLIIFSIIWLSAGFSFQKYHYYTVYMKESVSGLGKQGPVEFNGVEVGTIDDMIINKEHPELVQLNLKIKPDTPITYGTRATLGVRALSGVSYLLLEDKGTDKRLLIAKEKEPYTVIETRPSVLIKIDKIMTQIGASFQQMSNALRSLLSNENIQAIKRVLHKLGG